MGNQEKIRRYDIDWLRVAAVLLLIPFHTMHIFILKPYSVVYIKNSTGCSFYESITMFIHAFHMPLLFFLAGASVYFSLQSRGAGRFMKERIQRLLIPFITGILFLIPPMTYIYRISIGDGRSLFTHYIHFFSSNPGDFSGLTGAFTPAHLWFILFLFIFSLVGVPIFLYLNKHREGRSGLRKILSVRLGLLLFTIPLAIAAAVNLLDDKNPLVYFLIFILGYIVMTREEYQGAIDRDMLIYFIIGVVFEIIEQCTSNSFPEWSIGWICYNLMVIANRLAWIFAFAGLGHQFLNRPSKVLSYLSKASFPVYILHLPVNTAVGYFIVKADISIGLKTLLIIVLTMVFTFACYEIVRRFKLFCFLLGIKQNK